MIEGSLADGRFKGTQLAKKRRFLSASSEAHASATSTVRPAPHVRDQSAGSLVCTSMSSRHRKFTQIWLNKLNEFNGNFEQAEMVKAFIVSAEYRARPGDKFLQFLIVPQIKLRHSSDVR